MKSELSKIIMQKNVVEIKLKCAAERMFKRQPNIFDFTSETGQTEWSLAHHLANEIHRLLSGYDCDIDVTKRNFGYQRPDIVIHERGTNAKNLLVVEIKRDGGSSALKEDMKKIKEDWFSGRLRYKFGAVINLKGDKTFSCQVIENDNIVSNNHDERSSE
jgi:hypothetical protein